MKKSGFTLMELVVVIAILAVLSLFLYPHIAPMLIAPKEITCQNNRHVMETDISLLIAQNGQVTNLDDLSDYQDGKYNGKVICPADGYISYHNQRIYCTFHDGLVIGVDSFEVNFDFNQLQDSQLKDLKIDNGDVILWKNNYYVIKNARPITESTLEEYIQNKGVKINFDKYYEEGNGDPQPGDVKKFYNAQGQIIGYGVYFPEEGVPDEYNWVAIQPKP